MTIKDNEGHTPLDIAKNSENEGCVEVILSKEQANSEEASADNEEGKASNDDDSTTQIVSVDVHETETEGKDEEGTGLVTEDTGLVTEDTSQEDQTEGDTEPSLDEHEPSSSPPPKKKERRVSFMLDGEEPEMINEEISDGDPKITEGAISEIGGDDENKKQSATDQSSEAAVSY